MTKTVFIVDDDPDDLEILSELIHEFDAEIICRNYRHPEDALREIKNGILPHYIFLDINLPRVTGDEYLTEFRGRRELTNTVIIMQSTAIDPRIIQGLKSNGADFVFEKPSAISIYRQFLKEILCEH
jgi:CheY-like chemotaxis protein